MTDDEADLAALFAAARGEDPPLRPALLSAILTDAATVSAARRPAPGRWRLLGGLGGWGATALAAAAVLGFWLGIAGDIDITNPSAWAGARTAESDADPVAAFFDLASAEN
jgi:hypothetical protein